jgi:hypothetical protein
VYCTFALHRSVWHANGIVRQMPRETAHHLCEPVQTDYPSLVWSADRPAGFILPPTCRLQKRRLVEIRPHDALRGLPRAGIVLRCAGHSHVSVLARRRRGKSVVLPRLPDCRQEPADNPLLPPCSNLLAKPWLRCASTERSYAAAIQTWPHWRPATRTLAWVRRTC